MKKDQPPKPITPPRMETVMVQPATLAFLFAALPKKRVRGRPKKPPATILTGLRIPKANGRPHNPVKPPGKPGAPKKYDASTMSAFIERIDERKSKARAEGCAISDDRALRDDIVEHYNLEKRVAAKIALGLSKRAAEDRVFKEIRLVGTATRPTTTLGRRFRTLKVLLSKFRNRGSEIQKN